VILRACAVGPTPALKEEGLEEAVVVARVSLSRMDWNQVIDAIVGGVRYRSLGESKRGSGVTGYTRLREG